MFCSPPLKVPYFVFQVLGEDVRETDRLPFAASPGFSGAATAAGTYRHADGSQSCTNREAG